MTDPIYVTKIHHDKGGDEMVVEDGGRIVIKPGGQIVDEEGANLLGAVGSADLPNQYHIAPAANSATYVHAAVNLGVAAQDVATGITNPDVPRTVTIKGIAGMTGNVVVTLTNILDEVVTDTIALNGATEVEGVKAAKSVTNIHFPAQTHTPTSQVETATVVGTVTGSGNAAVIVTAAGMTGSPKTIAVAVLNNDTAAQVAGKIRTALGLDADVTAKFAVSGATDKVILTALTPAANDGTLNIDVDNDTCTGLTDEPSSANTTAGVPYDTCSVGVAKKFGLPQIVANAALVIVHLFDGSNDVGSLAVDSDEIEKNLYSLAGTPDGAKKLDLYYLI